jgi:hypothetical protein
MGGLRPTPLYIHCEGEKRERKRKKEKKRKKNNYRLGNGP